MAGKAEKWVWWAEKSLSIDQQMQDLDSKIANLDISPEQISEMNNAISEIVLEQNEKVSEVISETKTVISNYSSEIWLSVLASNTNNKSMNQDSSLVISRENVVMKPLSLKDFLQLANV